MARSSGTIPTYVLLGQINVRDQFPQEAHSAVLKCLHLSLETLELDVTGRKGNSAWVRRCVVSRALALEKPSRLPRESFVVLFPLCLIFYGNLARYMISLVDRGRPGFAAPRMALGVCPYDNIITHQRRCKRPEYFATMYSSL